MCAYKKLKYIFCFEKKNVFYVFMIWFFVEYTSKGHPMDKVYSTNMSLGIQN